MNYKDQWDWDKMNYKEEHIMRRAKARANPTEKKVHPNGMNAVLVQYVRKNGVACGVLVALRREDGAICVDYSLCNKGKDQFTKQRALEIAVGRAMKKGKANRFLPRSLYAEMKKFNERVCRYYKTNLEDIITW